MGHAVVCSILVHCSTSRAAFSGLCTENYNQKFRNCSICGHLAVELCWSEVRMTWGMLRSGACESEAVITTFLLNAAELFVRSILQKMHRTNLSGIVISDVMSLCW